MIDKWLCEVDIGKGKVPLGTVEVNIKEDVERISELNFYHHKIEEVEQFKGYRIILTKPITMNGTLFKKQCIIKKWITQLDGTVHAIEPSINVKFKKENLEKS